MVMTPEVLPFARDVYTLSRDSAQVSCKEIKMIEITSPTDMKMLNHAAGVNVTLGCEGRSFRWINPTSKNIIYDRDKLI